MSMRPPEFPGSGMELANVPERLWDLLAQRATDGLTAAEAVELAELNAQYPGVDDGLFDMAAGEVWAAANLSTQAAIPQRVVESAQREVDAIGRATGAMPLASPTQFGKRTMPRGGRWATLGWLTAAAAIMLAAFAWLTRPTAPPTPVVVAPPTVAELRQRLIATATDLKRVSLTRTKDPLAANIVGEVVWSDAQGDGYLLITGLQPNAAVNVQYQLWVFDEARTTPPHPVSAGLFDVPAKATQPVATTAQGELIVRFMPSLPVSRAKLFAISAEAPGGSVLPTMERVLMTAQ